MCVATSTAITLGVGLGTAGAGIIAAHETSGASEDSAQIQSTAQEQIAAENAAAQKYAADLQAKATADALAFSKAGAENTYQNNEVSREGSYDDYAAAQNRIGGISKLLGMGDRAIPAYRPGVDPNFSGDGTTAPSTSGVNYQPLVSALNQGQTPQQVIDQFNSSQGLPNGSSYAWRAIPGAPGGGVVEIPGGAYLAPGPDGTWGYTAGPSGSTSPAAPTGPSVASAFTLAPTAGQVAPPIAPGLTMPGPSTSVNPYAVSSYFG